jgi:hypothetical protein
MFIEITTTSNVEWLYYNRIRAFVVINQYAKFRVLILRNIFYLESLPSVVFVRGSIQNVYGSHNYISLFVFILRYDTPLVAGNSVINPHSFIPSRIFLISCIAESILGSKPSVVQVLITFS